MARMYRLTSDISEKEKAVGGILTFGQAGWLALGLLVFGVFFVALSRITSVVFSFTVALIPGLGIALPFAFYEKGGLKMSSYLVWRVRFARKSRSMVNTMTYKLDRPRDYAREMNIKSLLDEET